MCGCQALGVFADFSLQQIIFHNILLQLVLHRLFLISLPPEHQFILNRRLDILLQLLILLLEGEIDLCM